MIFNFAEPGWLYLLILLPFLFWLQGRVGRHASVRFPSIILASQIAAFVRQRPGRFKNSLRWLALAFFILALARPQTGEELSSTQSSGVDIVIAVDLSTSMWAHDFEINGVPTDRLTALRSVIRDFIRARRNDRIGLVAFAAEPYLVSPLSLNHDWLLRRLEELQIGEIEDGTAIGSAIGSSINRLQQVPSTSKIIILLTDGANNRGQLAPLTAAEAARALGIKIHTIGVGRTGPVPFPARFDTDGQPARNRDGRIFLRQALSDIDLDTLQKIAEMTGGRYYHATDSENFRRIYEEIDELEKTEVTLNVRRLYSEAFAFPLWAGLVLLLLDILLKQTRQRRLP